MCLKITPKVAEELRLRTAICLNMTIPPKPNKSREEVRHLKS